MRNILKFKDCFLYLAFIILIAVALFKQIQPRFIGVINLFRQIKSQNEVKVSMDQQLMTAAAKVAQKKKLRMGNDMVKKIYTPLEGGTDTDSAFSVLLDDIIEIADYIDALIKEQPDFSETDFNLTWDRVKDNIVFVLVNGETNRDLLNRAPHVSFLDFLGTIAEGVGDMHRDGHDDDHFGCKHRAVHSFDPFGPYFEYFTHVC